MKAAKIVTAPIFLLFFVSCVPQETGTEIEPVVEAVAPVENKLFETATVAVPAVVTVPKITEPILISAAAVPPIVPGQFVQIEVKDSKKTFLRRPFSVHDVSEPHNSITLLIKKVGQGTKKLEDLAVDQKVSVIYPLGTGFSDTKEKDVLLIGGGCGVAPLLYLAKHLHSKNIKPHIVLGGRTKQDVARVSEYENWGRVDVTTEDGSWGEKGLVMDHSILKDTDFKQIFACGPEPMLKSIASFAKEKKIDCEVSLENEMACGIGACLCCVTETKEGHQCICTEGPVFNARDLKW